MSFSNVDYANFSTEIVRANGFSNFNIEFFETGSFIQVTNSTGKEHDVSFQAILAAIKDIDQSAECQSYIAYCFSYPSNVLKVEGQEQARFDSYMQQLQSGSSALLPITTFKYFEKAMRVIGKAFLSDGRAKVIAGEQTKVLFAAISRFTYIANGVNQATLISPSVPTIDEEMPFSAPERKKTIEYLEGLINFMTHKPKVYSTSFPSINKIFYGAPGTGKSHKIHNVECNGSEKIVTVFHPDTLYNDFVGSLKPAMQKKTDGSSEVSYKFRPGPFTEALILAMSKPSIPVCLVIEEINRAPAAAVFGELFQLLDRKDTGESSYQINATDPDMLDYINEQLKASGRPKISTLEIPANLSLLATMNSSDQAVMPLDTAFKRRWSFEYLNIDFEHTDVLDTSISVRTNSGEFDISWPKFAEAINKVLVAECKVPEDRLVGQFFLNRNELKDEPSMKEALKGKLFVYLWDDVLRHIGHNKIFSDSQSTFGELSSNFEKGDVVFSDILLEEIESNGEKLDTPESQNNAAE